MAADATAAPHRPPANDAANANSEDARKKSDRAKARWGILRAALLGKSDDVTAEGNVGGCGGGKTPPTEASIHRFRGFRMLDRRVVPGGLRRDHPRPAEGASSVPLSPTEDNEEGKHECAEYVVPVRRPGSGSSSSDDSSVPPSLRVRTRERKRRPRTKVDVKTLLSHRLHGVDNTGNVAVWDAENVLTYYLFCGVDGLPVSRGGPVPDGAPLGLQKVLSLATQPTAGTTLEAEDKRKVLRVVELGAGMAGLASLALSALSRAKLWDNVAVNAVITDGHPNCVENNEINMDLTSALYPSCNNDLATVQSRRLLWDASSSGAAECASLNLESNGLFDLVLASDCTHFRDFHASLVATLGRLLRVGGWAVLCQPRRGPSLGQFMNMVQVVNGNVADEDVDSSKGDAVDLQAGMGPLFEISLLDRYNDVLWAEHESLQEKGDGTYDPDIHYPLLLLLRKMRSYNECEDTNTAIRHQEERDHI